MRDYIACSRDTESVGFWAQASAEAAAAAAASERKSMQRQRRFVIGRDV